MKKKLFLLVLILYFTCGILRPDHQLAGIISQKQWATLPAIFADDSYEILSSYFKHAQSIRFVVYNIDKLTYKAKFPDFAEIGTITYEKKEERFTNLRILNQINPLFFIEKFRCYPVKDRTIKVGEAFIHFQQGNLFQSAPFGQVLLFNGKWKFTLAPSDAEERLTLIKKSGKNYFSMENEWGIFILSNRSFLEQLNSTGLIETDRNDIVSLLGIYREYFGIQIKQFNEHWYLPFKQEDNLIVFRMDKDTFYLYDFNANLSPDTLLRTSPENRIVLSYNSNKTAKLSFQEVDKIEKIGLNLFYNPVSHFISGTAILSFKNPSAFKVLNLAKGLKIKANLDMESKGLSVVRKGHQYYFLGPPTDKFFFFYSGNIVPAYDYSDIFKRQIVKVETTEMDNFFYLSRTQNFYPNSYIDFSRADISISVNKEFDCLATGEMIEVKKSDRNVYKFSSKSAKGISIVAGNFKLVKKLDTKVPLNIYSSEFSTKAKHLHVDVKSEAANQYGSIFDRLKKYFDFEKLHDAFEFLLDKYGELDVKEINLLFKRDLQEGGISDKGFILYIFNPDLSISRKINRDSPILLSSDSTNHLIHELAHQWWGGLLSWKSYRDIWITEGLAQFSVIFYLEKVLSKNKFSRILRKMKRWIYRKNDAGPVIYGKRIINIGNDYEAYQSIVYNKAALIFLMLKDILGEKEFLNRLRAAVEQLKYKSVSSSGFIKVFSEGSEVAADFLKNWVVSRKIPEVRLYKSIKGDRAHLRIEQPVSDFTFPLKIEVKTTVGSSSRILIIRKKTQMFDIEENARIKSIDVDESRTLVKVEFQ